MSNQSPIHELFAYLCVSNASEAIQFYTSAFNAKETFRLTEPSGRVGHAQLDLGSGITLMLSEEFPEMGIKAPPAYGGTPVRIHLHVDNADAIIDRAVAAGATIESPARDQFYGERSGNICDPFGHHWNIGHSIENVDPAEMQRRYTAMFNPT